MLKSRKAYLSTRRWLPLIYLKTSSGGTVLKFKKKKKKERKEKKIHTNLILSCLCAAPFARQQKWKWLDSKRTADSAFQTHQKDLFLFPFKIVLNRHCITRNFFFRSVAQNQNMHSSFQSTQLLIFHQVKCQCQYEAYRNKTKTEHQEIQWIQKRTHFCPFALLKCFGPQQHRTDHEIQLNPEQWLCDTRHVIMWRGSVPGGGIWPWRVVEGLRWGGPPRWLHMPSPLTAMLSRKIGPGTLRRCTWSRIQKKNSSSKYGNDSHISHLAYKLHPLHPNFSTKNWYKIYFIFSTKKCNLYMNHYGSCRGPDLVDVHNCDVKYWNHAYIVSIEVTHFIPITNIFVDHHLQYQSIALPSQITFLGCPFLVHLHLQFTPAAITKKCNCLSSVVLSWQRWTPLYSRTLNNDDDGTITKISHSFLLYGAHGLTRVFISIKATCFIAFTNRFLSSSPYKTNPLLSHHKWVFRCPIYKVYLHLQSIPAAITNIQV